MQKIDPTWSGGLAVCRSLILLAATLLCFGCDSGGNGNNGGDGSRYERIGPFDAATVNSEVLPARIGETGHVISGLAVSLVAATLDLQSATQLEYVVILHFENESGNQTNDGARTYSVTGDRLVFESGIELEDNPFLSVSADCDDHATFAQDGIELGCFDSNENRELTILFTPRD